MMPSERPPRAGSDPPGFLLGAALASTTALAVSPAFASRQSDSSMSPKPTIVLIHGAWADASSWNGVVTKLQEIGYTVYAPPNPLRGLLSDAASIATFVNAIPGSVILVGHSYGGSVTSIASSGRSNVKALVYVDAFIPDAGDSCLGLLASGPPPPKGLFTPIPFATGGDADLYLTPKYFGPVFAGDVPPAIASAMAATQRPVTASALNAKAPAALGWKTLPSWYVIGDIDNVIPPALQLMMARRAMSHVSHVHGAHPSMIEHPEATVAAIIAAAAATT